VAGAGVAHLVLTLKISRRRKAFDAQLPEILGVVASSLRAGHSFSQSLQAVATDAEEPAAGEFRRVLTEVRLGRALDDDLADLGRRIRSTDLDFVLSAVAVQREAGGSIAGIFEIVGETVRQRHIFARKIRALTAMGRASAYVLLAAPFLIAGVLTLMNHDYMLPLFVTSTGHKLIAVALVMMGVGALFLKKIVSFKGIA
jgi:tight adherence protein B